LFNADGWILARDVTGVRFTTTGGAASFTSTGVAVNRDNCDRPATEEEILQAQLLVLKQGKSNININGKDDTSSSSSSSNNSKKKLSNKKGLVRIVTNLGDMVVELHCDIAPRTCYNFLGLCRSGSYNNSKFHRLIPNFMIQGGKAAAAATATGAASKNSTTMEDESFWGNRPFPDEFDDRLQHDGPGILSM
jgi:peptidyl-prolyl cis-trans isomerase-like 2